MTNIWADSYKEIRRPFFETESLEEERAKRDYDDDGKIESGAKEHAGAVHNAIQRKRGGKPDGQDTSSVKEDVEQVDEEQDATPPKGQSKYGRKAPAGYMQTRKPTLQQMSSREKQAWKNRGIGEEVEEIDEAQVANRDPENYEREQAKKSAPVRGERTPMPPRGDRRREDFERWYRANVREEVEEIDEEITSEKGKAKAAEMIAKRTTASGRAKSGQGDTVAQIRHISRANVDGYGGTPPNRKTAKNPVKSNFTGLKGGTGNKAARRAGLTPTRENPNAWKEEVETLAEVDSCGSSMDKKVDVMKSGKKNKVVINPPIREEVQEWVDELVSEGYDLSEFTWEEMTKIYESAELEEQMPARGDAETVDATDTAKLSAKRRMAQAQIRADLARVQYQKAAITRESFDSIVEYLSQRSDAFENLEEGVYDPKKSKLRPASERSQRSVTPKQRAAAKKAAARTAEIHSKGETVLAGLRPQSKRGKVQTTPAPKSPAPAANRTVTGRYDKLAKAASKVLKSTQNEW